MDYNQEQEAIREVQAKYPDVEFPKARLVDLYYKDMDPSGEVPKIVENTLENEHLILSTYNGETCNVATCSDEYKLVAHELAIWEFENMMREHPEFPISNGLDIRFRGPSAQVMYASLTQPLSEGEVKIGDPVNLRAGIVNSIDKSKELTGYFDAQRLVCLNGMTASFMNHKISKKHRQCLDVEDHMQVIGESLELFSDQFGIWQKWAELEMSKNDAEEILEILPFGTKYQEELLELRETSTRETLTDWMKKDRVNAWDMNNVVTQFISHEVEKEAAQQKYQDESSRVFHSQFERLRRKYNGVGNA